VGFLVCVQLHQPWLALGLICDSPPTGCAKNNTHMWHKHWTSNIEWSRHVISIVAYCHGVKLCALVFGLSNCNKSKRKVALFKIYLNFRIKLLLHIACDNKNNNNKFIQMSSACQNTCVQDKPTQIRPCD